MHYRLRVDDRVVERFPGYSVLLLYASGLTNGPSDDRAERALREAEAVARQQFDGDPPTTHAHVGAWRAAFSAFGAKPSKYPCSVEALLSRVLKGHELPAINQVVDLYNALSVRYVLPIGGEDRDALTSDSTLTFATGNEPFVAIGGDGQIVYPEPGEVIWADSSGVTCRRWNWRQCRRTALTEDTRNAYFVLDRLTPYPLDELRACGEQLAGLLRLVSPGCEIESELLGSTAD
jgi:DNA/RNA-binding domain of Phe-tRNA-synthetase-like protein